MLMSLKLLFLVPASVLSVAVVLKLSTPGVVDFSVLDLSSMSDGFGSWLRPWYMFVAVNSIIAAIFACSKLLSEKDDDSPPASRISDTLGAPEQAQTVSTPGKITQMDSPAADLRYNSGASELRTDYDTITEPETNFVPYEKFDSPKIESTSFHLSAPALGFPLAGDAASNKENEFVVSKSSSWKSPAAKPLVPPRFNHRRNSKSSPQGRKTMLALSKRSSQHTLEATWRTVTEGRAMPLTRQVNKSEAWSQESEKTPQKTSTGNANARSSPSSEGSSGRRDELNRRIEAFIRKFNEDMRQQR